MQPLGAPTVLGGIIDTLAPGLAPVLAHGAHTEQFRRLLRLLDSLAADGIPCRRHIVLRLQAGYRVLLHGGIEADIVAPKGGGGIKVHLVDGRRHANDQNLVAALFRELGILALCDEDMGVLIWLQDTPAGLHFELAKHGALQL